jgi:hypothetical protein
VLLNMDGTRARPEDVYVMTTAQMRSVASKLPVEHLHYPPRDWASQPPAQAVEHLSELFNSHLPAGMV